MERDYKRAMAVAQARAAARAAALLKKAEKDAAQASARLAAADRARQDGHIAVANLIYARVAVSGRSAEHSETARERLGSLGEEARQRIEEIDAMLAGQGEGESYAERVSKAFKDYHKAVREYGEVPVEGQRVKRHVAQQRRKPEYAAVLNEPVAQELWRQGQEDEQKDHACCAYQVYEQAARLSPAPSALQAKKRLDEMKEDPEVVKAAKLCRELRWCHKTYKQAERLIKLKPERAKELLSQIVSRSGEDTAIHVAAARKLRGID